MKHGPRRRGDHAQTTRKLRQRPLAGRVEQPLAFELLLQPLELGLPDAHARRLHEVHDELEIAARLVERHVAVGQHLRPILDRRAAGRATEHHAAELGLFVLQGEV